MDFDFTGSFWVEPSDLDEMVRLCEELGYKPKKALDVVSTCWDDCDYYMVDFVADQICAEIKRRILSKR